MPVASRVFVLTLVLALPAVTARGQAGGLTDLPLHEVPRTVPGGVLGVLFSGDGNWAKLDRTMAEQLAALGVATIGVESRSWLTQGATKDPTSAARDLTRILAAYQPRWGGDTLLILGYSRGAEIAPFAVQGLAPAWRARVHGLVLLGPSPTANFTFHFADLLRDHVRPDDVPLAPVIAALHDVPILCVRGDDEKLSLCTPSLPGNVTTRSTPGGHHFDGDYRALADSAVRFLRRPVH
ncbi:MAG TPA: AcvB/VirJ family lysyl-phosphatidylglycerol hydrolase [Gemmatimonadales bacterium]|nr:AcvB/VirJ family lysyl-phosphatidylglycerol hydrolase [Gemmatimonadales bacterium]